MLARRSTTLLVLQLAACNVDSTVGYVDDALAQAGSCSSDAAARCDRGECTVTNVFDAPRGAITLAADDTDLFFLTSARSIGRRALESEAGVELAAADSTLMRMAADATHVYWTELNGEVRGVAKAGGARFEASYVFGNPTHIAVDATHLYWVFPEFGQVALSPKPSGNAAHIAGQNSPQAIDTDATHVYWVNAGTGTAGGELMRAVRGDLTTTALVLSGLETPVAITVSSEAVHWASKTALFRWVKGGSVAETVATGFSEVKDIGVYGRAVYGVGMEGLWRVDASGGEWQPLERRPMSGIAIACSGVYATGWFENALVRYGP